MLKGSDLSLQPFQLFLFNQVDPGKNHCLYHTELDADIDKMEKLYKAPDQKQLKVSHAACFSSKLSSRDVAGYHLFLKAIVC